MLIKLIFISSILLTYAYLNIAFADDNLMKKYGIQKQTTDSVNTRTDTYMKELGKTKSGNGYGIYGSSTKEYKSSGERDSSANEKPGGSSLGAGIYKKF